MNLLANYSLLHRIMAENALLPDLKPLIARWTGQRIRRLDRYIELCIAGGLGCVAGRSLPADSGIYLATRCGAVTTSAAVMQAIIADGESPKPLHFVNTIGNSAGFYLTQLLGVTGNVIVVSQEYFSFEAALLHAWLDLQAGRVSCALVGGFDEVALPLSCHSVRLEAEHAECFTEGSHWLLLERAGTLGIQVGCPFYAETSGDLQGWLRQHPEAQVQVSFVPNDEERSWLPASCTTLIDRQFDQVARIAFHGVFSGEVLSSLAELTRERGGQAIHVARDSAQRYCAVLLEATV